MGMYIDFTKSNPLEGICPVETWEQEIVDFIKNWKDTLSFEIKTSGSTGTPKIIKCLKQAMIASAKITGNYFGFTEGQTALHCLPAKKISGIMMIVRAIVWKLKLYCIAPKIELALDKLPSSIDFAAMIPAQALHNIDKLQHIKQLLLGGAAIPSILKNKLRTLPVSSYLSYGMTETLSHIAIQKLNESSLFVTMEGVNIYTNDDNCLIINAPNIGVERLQTNDIVSIVSETQFEYLGRYDNIINSGGLKIIPEEIEAQINKIFPLHNFYIGLTSHDTWGEQITLFWEGKPLCKDEENNLVKKLQSIKPKQAIPKKIIYKNHFDRTETGKIIRK